MRHQCSTRNVDTHDDVQRLIVNLECIYVLFGIIYVLLCNTGFVSSLKLIFLNSLRVITYKLPK